MGLIISLQGCMAVGKTTIARYIEKNNKNIVVNYELNNNIIENIKERKLNKNNIDDYIEIQRMWIENEITRFEKTKDNKYSLMDFGAEEIEFYTLNYPKAMGFNWDVYPYLKKELENLQKCMPDKILFLDANNETLIKHKENDNSRSRNFFDCYLNNLLPLKKSWFKNKDNIEFIKIDDINQEDLLIKINNIINNYIKNPD